MNRAVIGQFGCFNLDLDYTLSPLVRKTPVRPLKITYEVDRGSQPPRKNLAPCEQPAECPAGRHLAVMGT